MPVRVGITEEGVQRVWLGYLALNIPLPRFTGGGLPFIASEADRLFLSNLFNCKNS